MGKGPIGRCRLCGAENVELRESHILPAFAYRQARDGQKQHILLANGTSSYSNKELKEYLLGDCCEALFNKWETAVAPILAQDEDSPLPWMTNVTPTPDGRTGMSASSVNAAVAPFVASVIWRAAVASYPHNDLGPYEERFRKYLLDATAFPDDAYLLVSLVTGKLHGVYAQRHATLPQRGRFGQAWRHRFMCSGADFCIIVGKRAMAGLDDACFVRTKGRVRLHGEELMEGILKPVANNRKVGKLAREFGSATFGRR